jgi:hypothetical protein
MVAASAVAAAASMRRMTVLPWRHDPKPWDAIATNFTVPLCERKFRLPKCATTIYLGLDDGDASVAVFGASLGCRSFIWWDVFEASDQCIVEPFEEAGRSGRVQVDIS